MKTGTIIFIKGNAIRIGHEDFFINSVDLSKIKEGMKVDYENEGPNLKTIKETPTGPQLAEDQTVLTAVHLEDQKPFIILTNLRGQFTKIVLPVAFGMVKSIPVGKFIRYKTNKESTSNPIEKIWEVDANGKGVNGNGNNQNWKPKKTVTIGGTINIGNYENIKLEISGPYESLDDAKKLKSELIQVASLFGINDQTREIVQGYCDRVLGKGGQ